MKLVIAAVVVGRKALHRYGHPLKFKENTNMPSYIKPIQSKISGDSKIYTSIYSPNKYKILETKDKAVVNSFLMVVDDNFEKVYKFCSIGYNQISMDEFDTCFGCLNLSFVDDIPMKEKRKAFMLLVEYNKVNVIDSIFNYYDVMIPSIIKDQLLIHFDLLIERYLSLGDIKTLQSLIYNFIESDKIFEYIDKKQKLSYKVHKNITELLYSVIFEKGINLLSNHVSCGLSFKLLSSFKNENSNMISVEKLKIMFKFIYKLNVIDSEKSFEDYYRRFYMLEDFFTMAYYLLGKPDLEDDEYNKIANNFGTDSLPYLNSESAATAIDMVRCTKECTENLFERASIEELKELFVYRNFDPFNSFKNSYPAWNSDLNETNNIKWIINKEYIDLYNSVANRDKELKKIINSRFKVPATRNTAYAIELIDSFDSSMFFIYMQTNYKLFMKDVSIIGTILSSVSPITAVRRIDFSKFVNKKIKDEVMDILLFRLECLPSDNLKFIFKSTSVKYKKEIDKELIDAIKNSHYRKLKEVIKCARL